MGFIRDFFVRGSDSPEPIDPLQRAKDACDALNEAIAGLPPELKHIRPWVRNGDARYRRRSKVMLGYWSPHPDLQMVIIHGDDKPGMPDY